MTVIDHEQTLQEQCEAIWKATLDNEQRDRFVRELPPVVRLWDGEMRLQHLVQAEYSGNFDLIDGDTGPGELRHPFDHPVGQWLYDEKGRLERDEKRNVNITVDYAGSRWAGLLEYVELELDDSGDQVIVARFSSDYERLKWYTCWSNPWLPEWIQFPRVFIIAGPSTWLLSTLLDLQLQRERGSTWTLPSDPMDPAQREGLDQSTWSMVVKPISFDQAMADGSMWSIAASRFKNFHDIAKPIMEDAEITPVVRRWLEGDPLPWPGADLRHGTVVVSFEDRSGRYTGTAMGGSVFDGLILAFESILSGGIESTINLLTDTTIPADYYIPGKKRTDKTLPFAIWRDGEISGLEAYRFRKTGSKGVQIVTGGQSMPGVVCAPA